MLPHDLASTVPSIRQCGHRIVLTEQKLYVEIIFSEIYCCTALERIVQTVQTPLNASASTAGALLSNATFEIPPFQREYSWGADEVSDFWTDLSNNLESDTYFLGLVILTDSGSRKQVVDGQQRLITLTLLANAIYHEASSRGRQALADRIKADFLSAIDYESDDTTPRVKLSDENDNIRELSG